jgi:hypothetical protein
MKDFLYGGFVVCFESTPPSAWDLGLLLATFSLIKFASMSFDHPLIGLGWLVSILPQQIVVSGPSLIAL